MGQPLTAANAHLAGATPPDPCAELRREVERLRLLETMWKARVAWTAVGHENPKELALWEAYDKARRAYEAARGTP